MPWWSWLLIWSGLILGLFVMLGALAVRLFRQSQASLAALDDLAHQLVPFQSDSAAAPPRPASLAVFANPAELFHDVELRRLQRTYRDQVRRDARITRGKLLRNAR